MFGSAPFPHGTNALVEVRVTAASFVVGTVCFGGARAIGGILWVDRSNDDGSTRERMCQLNGKDDVYWRTVSPNAAPVKTLDCVQNLQQPQFQSLRRLKSAKHGLALYIRDWGSS